MKKIAFTILLTTLTTIAFGQITTTKIAPKADLTDNTPYDNTQNFLGEDVNKYLGQELYLKGRSESLRKYGYDNFVLDYTKDDSPINKSNIYKCCDGYNSKYNELEGKYFKVLEIIKPQKAEQNKYYLKLQEKESNDIVYFKYNSQSDIFFPFIVVSFFENQKNLLVGKEFVFADKILQGSTDIQTGKIVTVMTGQKWKCTDLTIEEKYYNLSLVIENSLGEKATISNETLSIFMKNRRVYTVTEADNYRKKFGSETFDKILQGKVKIGMTKEMAELAWGKPKRINETITAGKKSEQWIYSDNYLYFENGILTAMQQ